MIETNPPDLLREKLEDVQATAIEAFQAALKSTSLTRSRYWGPGIVPDSLKLDSGNRGIILYQEDEAIDQSVSAGSVSAKGTRSEVLKVGEITGVELDRKSRLIKYTTVNKDGQSHDVLPYHPGTNVLAVGTIPDRFYRANRSLTSRHRSTKDMFAVGIATMTLGNMAGPLVAQASSQSVEANYQVSSQRNNTLDIRSDGQIVTTAQVIPAEKPIKPTIEATLLDTSVTAPTGREDVTVTSQAVAQQVFVEEAKAIQATTRAGGANASIAKGDAVLYQDPATGQFGVGEVLQDVLSNGANVMVVTNEGSFFKADIILIADLPDESNQSQPSQTEQPSVSTPTPTETSTSEVSKSVDTTSSPEQIASTATSVSSVTPTQTSASSQATTLPVVAPEPAPVDISNSTESEALPVFDPTDTTKAPVVAVTAPANTATPAPIETPTTAPTLSTLPAVPSLTPLSTPTPTAASIPSNTKMSVLDCSSQCPTGEQIEAAGDAGVILYVAPEGDSSKIATTTEVTDDRDHDVAVRLVWEGNAQAALGGYIAGERDGKEALTEAEALGYPKGDVIDFAVDFDPTKAQLNTIDEYIEGAESEDKGQYTVAGYGSKAVIDSLVSVGITEGDWQTSAWSNGQWDSIAQIHQISNGHSLDGGVVDYDTSYGLSGWWLPTQSTEQSSTNVGSTSTPTPAALPTPTPTPVTTPTQAPIATPSTSSTPVATPTTPTPTPATTSTPISAETPSSFTATTTTPAATSPSSSGSLTSTGSDVLPVFDSSSDSSGQTATAPTASASSTATASTTNPANTTPSLSSATLPGADTLPAFDESSNADDAQTTTSATVNAPTANPAPTTNPTPAPSYTTTPQAASTAPSLAALPVPPPTLKPFPTTTPTPTPTAAPKPAVTQSSSSPTTAAPTATPSSSQPAPSGDNLVAAVIRDSNGNAELAVSMLTGANLESNGNSQSVGDNGHSDGAFQIHNPVEDGITVAEAKDPDAATQYMLRDYGSALKVVPASAWANPTQAAEEVAYNAERPASNYYATQGAARVNAAFQKAVDELKEAGMTINFG